MKNRRLQPLEAKLKRRKEDSNEERLEDFNAEGKTLTKKERLERRIEDFNERKARTKNS